MDVRGTVSRAVFAVLGENLRSWENCTPFENLDDDYDDGKEHIAQIPTSRRSVHHHRILLFSIF